MASIAEGGVGFAGGGEEKWIPRNPLVVQWLGLCASAAGTGVQSLVQEPRSCKWQGAAKKKKRDPERKVLGSSLCQPVAPTRSPVLCLPGFLNSPLVITDPSLYGTLWKLKKTFMKNLYLCQNRH